MLIFEQKNGGLPPGKPSTWLLVQATDLQILVGPVLCVRHRFAALLGSFLEGAPCGLARIFVDFFCCSLALGECRPRVLDRRLALGTAGDGPCVVQGGFLGLES